MEPNVMRARCWLGPASWALGALALASCSSQPAWESSSAASTCSVATDVYWTPASPDAGPPEPSCFPVAVPASQDGSTPCAIYVATGADPCRADRGALAIADDERRAVAPLETGTVCRLAQVPADASGSCVAPGVCFTHAPAAGGCPLRVRLHPDAAPTTLSHVVVRCAWPAPCP